MMIVTSSQETFGKNPPKKSYYMLGKFARLISLQFIEALSKTSVKPLHLSIASMVFSIIASILYSFNHPFLNLAALTCFMLFFILDHMDGDLARYLNEQSYLGEIIDHIIGKISILLIYLGICLGLIHSHNPGHIWFMALILVAGFFGSEILVSKRMIMVTKNKIRSHKFDRKDPFSEKDSIFRTIFNELTSIHMMAFYFIILGSIFDKLYYSILFTLLHTWAYYIFQTYTTFKYFKQVDSQS